MSFSLTNTNGQLTINGIPTLQSLQTSLINTNSSLNSEITSRTINYGQLSSILSTQYGYSISADTTLSAEISSELHSRISGDTSLTNQITSLESEISTLKALYLQISTSTST